MCLKWFQQTHTLGCAISSYEKFDLGIFLKNLIKADLDHHTKPEKSKNWENQQKVTKFRPFLTMYNPLELSYQHESFRVCRKLPANQSLFLHFSN